MCTYTGADGRITCKACQAYTRKQAENESGGSPNPEPVRKVENIWDELKDDWTEQRKQGRKAAPKGKVKAHRKDRCGLLKMVVFKPKEDDEPDDPGTGDAQVAGGPAYRHPNTGAAGDVTPERRSSDPPPKPDGQKAREKARKEGYRRLGIGHMKIDSDYVPGDGWVKPGWDWKH